MRAPHQFVNLVFIFIKLYKKYIKGRERENVGLKRCSFNISTTRTSEVQNVFSKLFFPNQKLRELELKFERSPNSSHINLGGLGFLIFDFRSDCRHPQTLPKCILKFEEDKNQGKMGDCRPNNSIGFHPDFMCFSLTLNMDSVCD